MAKEYDIGVWDIQFYKVDKNGMELQNPDGSVKLFQLKEDDKLDIGYNFFIRDFVQLKWRMTTKATIAVVGLCLFIYVVFFWIDTVQEIRFEIIYF